MDDTHTFSRKAELTLGAMQCKFHLQMTLFRTIVVLTLLGCSNPVSLPRCNMLGLGCIHMKLYTFPFLFFLILYVFFFVLAGKDVSLPVLLLAIADYSSLYCDTRHSGQSRTHLAVSTDVVLFQTNKGHLCKSISPFTMGLSAPCSKPYDYIIHVATS